MMESNVILDSTSTFFFFMLCVSQTAKDCNPKFAVLPPLSLMLGRSLDEKVSD